jgi:hypothetical protein
MGFSDNPVLVIVTISLIVQLVVLALLLFSYNLKRQKKFRLHGITMALAVILHAVVIAAVMVPVFVLIFRSPHLLSFNASITTGLIHGFMGIVAFVGGVFLVASWKFNKNMIACFKKKIFMRWTMVLWVASLVLGIILYYLLYVLSVPI